MLWWRESLRRETPGRWPQFLFIFLINPLWPHTSILGEWKLLSLLSPTWVCCLEKIECVSLAHLGKDHKRVWGFLLKWPSKATGGDGSTHSGTSQVRFLDLPLNPHWVTLEIQNNNWDVLVHLMTLLWGLHQGWTLCGGRTGTQYLIPQLFLLTGCNNLQA